MALDLKFLVVDDFSTMRRIVANIISESGYGRAEEASDGAEALDKLKASPYDFVVSDINMPNMNGFDFLQRVKADENLKHIPVLLVTAEGRKRRHHGGCQNGCGRLYRQTLYQAGVARKSAQHLGEGGALGRLDCKAA